MDLRGPNTVPLPLRSVWLENESYERNKMISSLVLGVEWFYTSVWLEEQSCSIFYLVEEIGSMR